MKTTRISKRCEKTGRQAPPPSLGLLSTYSKCADRICPQLIHLLPLRSISGLPFLSQPILDSFKMSSELPCVLLVKLGRGAASSSPLGFSRTHFDVQHSFSLCVAIEGRNEGEPLPMARLLATCKPLSYQASNFKEDSWVDSYVLSILSYLSHIRLRSTLISPSSFHRCRNDFKYCDGLSALRAI